MTLISTPTWEQSLLSLAREAQPFHAATAPAAITDPVLLARVYAHCEALTARHSRSFHLASRFLPSDKRRAIRALYAFCRVAVAAAGDLYRAILGDIAAHDYDVFTRRAYVSQWGRLCRPPRLWWRERRPRTTSSSWARARPG